jgi:hypothetical protein
MKRDCSTLHNVRDQRRDLFDEKDFVEERAAVPPTEYIQEIEEVEETILIEVNEEEEDEAFEQLFSTEHDAQDSSLPQDMLPDIIDNNVRDAYDDDLADIPMDVTTHQGFAADANFKFVV